MFGRASDAEHVPVWNCDAGPVISSAHEWFVNFPAGVPHACTVYVPACASAAATNPTPTAMAAIQQPIRRSIALNDVTPDDARRHEPASGLGGRGRLRLGVVPRREDAGAGGGDR